jgi:hypothetical protein
MSKGEVKVAAFDLNLRFATNIRSRLVAQFPGNILGYSYDKQVDYDELVNQKEM